MEAAIRTEDGWLSFEAPTLEVARLIASASGFNVDLEPGAPGHVKLTATRQGPKGPVTITTNGSTVYEAAEKLIKGLTHG
jgi:hypothetical protein